MRVNGHSEQSVRQEMGKTALSHDDGAIVANYFDWESRQSYGVPSVAIIRVYFQLNVSIAVARGFAEIFRKKKGQSFEIRELKELRKKFFQKKKQKNSERNCGRVKIEVIATE